MFVITDNLGNEATGETWEAAFTAARAFAEDAEQGGGIITGIMILKTSDEDNIREQLQEITAKVANAHGLGVAFGPRS